MCDAPSYTVNQPAQPSYGEGMADALKAQVELLTGTGDFAKTGSLESLLPLEESIRKKTAQTDTDIFRQTLLGSEQKVNVVKDPKTGKFGIPGGKVVKDLEGTVSNRFQVFLGKEHPIAGRKYEIIDTETGAVVRPTREEALLAQGLIKKNKDGTFAKGDKFDAIYANAKSIGITFTPDQFFNNQIKMLKDPKYKYTDLYENDASGFADWYKYKTGGASEQDLETVFDFTDPNTGEPFDITEGKQITIREGDGLVDLLGDNRTVSEFTTRQATQEDVNAGLASEVGESITEATGGRKAGFDADGNFLGLSALAEDIQRGNLSRQREADLADVERLSDRYQDVMADYKPAATSGLDDARILLEQQRENLTGLRKATQADVDAGSATEVGELFQTEQGQGSGPISMPSTLDGYLDSADYAMSGDAAIGQLDSGEDTLRSALLADARGALDSGLTDREMKQVEESARARQTLMGRTFDQKGAIEEAEARIMEDNQRKMQNRAFAQSALGQEAGIQTGDAARAMTADQFNVGAKMDAERLNEQLRQQGLSNYINAVGNLAQMEDKFMLDPFQALLGRGGGNALQQGQSVFGQAGYGLNSGPQYLNPEAGLGYISQMAANEANMYGAQLAADASRSAGLMGGLGSLGGGLLSNASLFCWVAREVYGPTNPAWLQFREWMFNESPQWFFDLYRKYGERFASWISNKPRLKGIIRKWMDSKIGDK